MACQITHMNVNCNSSVNSTLILFKQLILKSLQIFWLRSQELILTPTLLHFQTQSDRWQCSSPGLISYTIKFSFDFS